MKGGKRWREEKRKENKRHTQTDFPERREGKRKRDYVGRMKTDLEGERLGRREEGGIRGKQLIREGTKSVMEIAVEGRSFEMCLYLFIIYRSVR